MRRFITPAAATAALFLGLAGCGGDGSSRAVSPAPSDATTTTVAESTTTTDVDVTTTAADGPVSILSGLPTTDELAARQVLAVKIENDVQAWPQSGLAEAELVFEIVVEGGQTRFMTFYQTVEPELLGPIRSTRPVDAALLGSFGQPVFAFSGGQNFIIRSLQEMGLELVADDLGSDALFRSPERSAPHNVYGTAAEIFAEVEPIGEAPTEPVLLRGEFPAEGDPASTVDIAFSGAVLVNYQYDEAEDRYMRSQAGEPYEDAEFGQVGADSLVVIYVQQASAGYVDAAGSQVPTFIVGGEGDALMVSHGRALQGRWERETTEGPFELFDADGEPVLLDPGVTWVHFVPIGGAVGVTP